jgi:NNP family nitrate/nitrite transporter-like MFS transporter
MASEKYQQWSVVASSTIAFTVCFMVWMMFAVIGIPIKQALGLNETQFGILVAMPVLTGSLIRLPLGMWTDKYGGRIVFFTLMLSTVFPIWLISRATEFWHFLVTGLFVGVAGGSFTVGIAYCARWFPRSRQGLAMGIFGVGNTGAAVTKLVAPTIVVAYGWTMVPQVYAVLMTVTAVLFWCFSYTDEKHTSDAAQVTVRQQLMALKDPRVWRYSQYYSIVFGGYVGLSLWMTKYYISEYASTSSWRPCWRGLQHTRRPPARHRRLVFPTSTARIRSPGGSCGSAWSACSSSPIRRPISRYTPCPGRGRSISASIRPCSPSSCSPWALPSRSARPRSSSTSPMTIRRISGWCPVWSAWRAALGGFILPIMFGALVDLTGVRSSAFMLMFGIVWVSLMWMYFTEVRPMGAELGRKHPEPAHFS